MLIHDIIYVVILLACIGIGELFRKIENPIVKQWSATGIGLLISIVVSGIHVLHPLICTIITASLLINLPKRIRHVAGFSLSFFYLLVIFRLSDSWYGGSPPPTHTNLIQMMLTLRLASLGFEMNSATESLQNDPDNETYKAVKNIVFMDIFHYGMGYMGLLTGPFYTYRTYWDCINRNFSKNIDCWKATLEKLKIIAFASILYLVLNYLYPIEYVYTEEFQECSVLYKYWYAHPAFLSFKARIYAGMMLSECVCQMAGLGAYPSSTQPISGLGPKDYKRAVQLANDPELMRDEKIDFETIHNIDITGVETCFSLRQAMKSWNITVQYWMAAYVYKQFPNRILRTPVTFIVSSVWHGYAFGYYVTILSVVWFLPAEDLYMKLYNHSPEKSLKKQALWIFLFFLRVSGMSYLGMGFLLLSYENTMQFLKNVYYVGHLFVPFLYIIGYLMHMYSKAQSNKKSN